MGKLCMRHLFSGHFSHVDDQIRAEIQIHQIDKPIDRFFTSEEKMLLTAISKNQYFEDYRELKHYSNQGVKGQYFIFEEFNN